MSTSRDGGLTWSATSFSNLTTREQSFSDNAATQANPRSVIRPTRRAE